MLGFVATIIHALIHFWQEKSSRYRRHRIKVCAGFARHFRVYIGALYVVRSAYSAQGSGLLLVDIPQMLGVLRAMVGLLPFPGNKIRARPASMTVGASNRLPDDAGTRGFPFIEVHSSSYFWPHCHHDPYIVGADSDRSRTISRRMSWGICRGTATSASWNITKIGASAPKITTSSVECGLNNL
jgi:hypothetical protein